MSDGGLDISMIARGARIWEEEIAVLDRMPWDEPWAPWSLHYKVEIRARDGGELLWVRPYRTRQEAIRACFRIAGPCPAPSISEIVVAVATVVTFNASNSNGALTWTSGGDVCPANVVATNCLLIGGGGAGGRSDVSGDVVSAGGGGAGGFRAAGEFPVTAGTAYPITVGAGGDGSSNPTTNGGNSVFSSLTAVGGGHGGTSATSRVGANGGSGGGGSGGSSSIDVGIVTFAGGSATSGQGNAGGTGYHDTSLNRNNAAGGGGAGSVGGDGPSTGSAGGNGGAGSTSTISGVSVTYAAGGGGCAAGSGVSGISGDAASAGGNGVSAPANTGGGGGGGSGGDHLGGDGSSGKVILSFTPVSSGPYDERFTSFEMI